MLEANKLSIKRSGCLLLDDLSIFLSPGEVLALVGANGAGKSTLLKVLAGEIKPDEGSVTLDGKPVDSWSAKALAKRRAVLPQHSTLNFPFTVFEIVIMGRSPHLSGNESARDIEITNQAIDAVEIDHLRCREFTSLSGGERQRVHLARVLAQIWSTENRESRRPRYLLLDEPTSALDLSHQHQLLSTTRRLAEEQNLGVLAIVHDLNLAALYADRIAMMRKGCLIHVGQSNKVLCPGTIREVFGIETDVFQHAELAVPCVVALPRMG